MSSASLQSLTAVVAAVALFLYGLQGFSRELRAVGGEALERWLGRATAHRLPAFAIGAVATALVQSSSAVTSLAAALVDAGAFGLRGALAVMLGANVGTTTTAWLVSMKVGGIGPAFIAAGALLSLAPRRAGLVGKAVFYFGLIFFALDLVSAAVEPLREHPATLRLLALSAQPWAGVLAGAAVTALVQSSSVTTGLAILLVQQGMLPPPAAIAIVVGSNAGSTVTALVASLSMSPTARASAIANAGFNIAGALLLLPVLPAFSSAVLARVDDPAQAVAAARLVFNLGIAVLFLPLLDRVCALLERARPVGDGAPDANRLR